MKTGELNDLRSVSNTVLIDFLEQNLSRAKRCDYLTTGFPIGCDDGVFHQEFVQVGVLVHVDDQLALSESPALVDKEVHDGLWNEVGNVLLHDRVVAENQVLNHASLHNDARAFLLGVGSQRARHFVEEDFREVAVLVDRWPLVLRSEMVHTARL